MTYKIIFLFIAVFYSNCPGLWGNANTTLTPTPTPKPPEKILTIFLVDRSGSFHTIRKEASGKTRNYFTEVCDKIKNYVNNKANRSKEQIIVREIASSSFSDATLVAEIDFAKDEYIFKVKEPMGPYDVEARKNWSAQKNEFDRNNLTKQLTEITAFEEKINNFKKNTASDKTDLINAFKSLPVYLEKYKDYSKEIIVYSDFKDDQIGTWKIENTLESLTSLEIKGGVVLGDDVQIKGEYISMDGLNPEKYTLLINAWKKVLKCKDVSMNSPPSDGN
jgi:hypothetical protein